MFVRFDIADRLRERGWVVPAYTLAPGAEHIRVLRALCREDFSIQSAEMCAPRTAQRTTFLTAKPALFNTTPWRAGPALPAHHSSQLGCCGHCALTSDIYSRSPDVGLVAVQLCHGPTDRPGVAGTPIWPQSKDVRVYVCIV